MRNAYNHLHFSSITKARQPLWCSAGMVNFQLLFLLYEAGLESMHSMGKWAVDQIEW